MMPRYAIAIGFVCAFLTVVFAAAFIYNPRYPSQVIAGESSVATWASGMLLVMSATIALVFAVRRGWMPWTIVALFFLLLGLDERFMFHERMKSKIIFRYSIDPTQQSIVAELPVLIGTLAGIMIALTLWRRLSGKGKMFLLSAAVLGTVSVVFDVLALGVLPEDSFKVFAELLIVCALLTEV